MINNLLSDSQSSGRLSRPMPLMRTLLYALTPAMLIAFSLACQSERSGSGNEARGIIVVNAPVTGEVRRIVAREGMPVGEGEPIIEIAVQSETPVAAPSPGENAESRAIRSFKAADAEIEAARAEVVRHEAEVARLTPLVANGEASAGQLDGERSLYERAQQRLQQARDAKKTAETGLLAARQPGPHQENTAPPAPREQLIAARASSNGIVSAISARVGDRVSAGQPLATLRAGQP